MKNNITLALLVFYIIIRFFFTTWLDTISAYSSYIFEITLVAIVAGLNWKTFKFELRLNKKIAYIAFVAGLSGFVILKLMEPLGIPLPFDLVGGNVWFFLLIVGPLLEELIFRFFAWLPIAVKNSKVAWIATSLLFSYSHLHAFWFVSPDIRSFVYYQTAYTLALGLACGYAVYKYKSLIGAILIHFLFNLGFFIAAIM